jgi:hypothetical protein
MKNDRLTRDDIKQWVENDEGLYNWWKSSRMSLASFVKANRVELERAIRRVRSGEKPAHYLAYGG